MTIALTVVLVAFFGALVAANLRPVQPPRYAAATSEPRSGPAGRRG